MLNYSKTQYCPTYIRIGADFLLLFSPWLLYSRRRCVTPYDASVYIALDGAVVSLRLRWHVQSMHNVQRRLVYRIFIGNTVGPCRWLYRRVEQQKRNIRLLLFYAVPCVRVVRCVPPFISLSVGSLSKPISALARERERERESDNGAGRKKDWSGRLSVLFSPVYTASGKLEGGNRHTNLSVLEQRERQQAEPILLKEHQHH